MTSPNHEEGVEMTETVTDQTRSPPSSTARSSSSTETSDPFGSVRAEAREQGEDSRSDEAQVMRYTEGSKSELQPKGIVIVNDNPTPSSELEAVVPLASTTKQVIKEILDTTPPTILIIVHQSPTTRPTTLMVNDNIHIITDPTPTTTLTPFSAAIRRAVRDNELGKLFLTMAGPMAIGMFTITNLVPAATSTMRVAAVSLSIGFVGILKGILLREVMDRASDLLEPFGIAFFCLSFFAIIACFLPLNLCWVPLLCCTVSIAYFVAAVFLSRSGGQPNNVAAPAPEAPRLPV